MDSPMRATQHMSEYVDMCTVFVPWCKDGHWSLYVADCNFGDMSAITVYHADSGIDGGFRHPIGAAVTTIAKAITKCAQESVDEIMQLIEVVDISDVPQQDDGVNCGVHVILNCKSILTHMQDGSGVGSWVPPTNPIREEEIPPCRQQLAAECTELKESKKKQKTTTILVKSPKKKNKKQRKSARAKK